MFLKDIDYFVKEVKMKGMRCKVLRIEHSDSSDQIS